MAFQTDFQPKDPFLEVGAVHLASAAQLVNQVPQEPVYLARQAEPEPQDPLMEVGAMHLASVVKFTPQRLLTTATVTLAFGAPAASEDSAIAMATARAMEEDTTQVPTYMAQRSSQDTAYTALATTLATTLAMVTLVLAMDPVCLVSE